MVLYNYSGILATIIAMSLAQIIIFAKVPLGTLIKLSLRVSQMYSALT